jgi:hypothetical protein
MEPLNMLTGIAIGFALGVAFAMAIAVFALNWSPPRLFDMSRSDKLAAALLADREQRATRQSRHNITACSSCGATFINKGARCCSLRCQQWLDAGNPTYDQQREAERALINAPLESLTVVAGPPGTVGRKPYAELFASVAESRLERPKRKVKAHA